MLSETKWGPKNYHLIGIYMPFHAAEQRNKELKNDSAEYPARGYKLCDFPNRQLFMSSTGKPKAK
jgi:hypothetical protein